MLGQKAGVVHLHIGDGKEGLGPLLELLECTDFPKSMFVPTHLNRNKALFAQAVQYWINGGNIDLTAGENTAAGCTVPDCLQQLLGFGKGLERVTVSSDGNGSGAGDSHTEVGSVMTLFEDIKIAVHEFKMPLETVLKTVTSNVAKLLKIYPVKGQLAKGNDADIILLNSRTFTLDMLFARGRLLFEKGSPI
jgi:beta-aspartyl-dipeptidase (metallo-type)